MRFVGNVSCTGNAYRGLVKQEAKASTAEDTDIGTRIKVKQVLK
jgi:hypothetical protein